MYDLVIKFPSKEALELFMSWLDNSGEQDYNTCAEEREELELTFTYDYDTKIVTTEVIDELE